MSEPTAQPDAQSQTKWLTAEQQEAWLTLIALVTRLPAALDTQLQRDSALTHFEYFVLAALSDAPDHKLQLSVLAQRANASLSRLSHVDHEDGESRLGETGSHSRQPRLQRSTHRRRNGKGRRGRAATRRLSSRSPLRGPR